MPSRRDASKGVLNEALHIRHPHAKVASHIQRGVGWEVPPLPEAVHLVPCPLLHLQQRSGAGFSQEHRQLWELLLAAVRQAVHWGQLLLMLPLGGVVHGPNEGAQGRVHLG